MTGKDFLARSWAEHVGRAVASLLERRPFVVSSVLVLALLLGGIALMHPAYRGNDDPSMSLFAAGVAVRETPDAHLLFMHAWIGGVLKRLYVTFPDYPWYAVLLYAVFAFASIALVYGLSTRRRASTTLLLFGVVFWANLVSYPQEFLFTIMALFSTAAGWLTAAATARTDDRVSGLEIMFAIIALLLGASVRSLGVAIGTLICVPVLLYAWWYARPSGRRRLARIALVAVVGAGLLHGLNLLYYRADPAWAQFYEYNALRATFNDWQVIRYDARTQPAFAAAGWSKNDYLMIRNWFHADPSTFSITKMRQIVGTVGGYGTDLTGGQAARQFFRTFATVHWLGVAIILVWIGGQWGFVRIWPLAATLGTAAGFIAAATLVLKPVPRGMALAISGICVLVGLFLAAPSSDVACRPRWRQWLALLMAAALVAYLAWSVPNGVSRASRLHQRQQALQKDVALLAPRHHDLYVVWGDAFPFRLIDPLASLAFLRGMRILPLGSELHTPHVAGTMRRFGIDDVYLALATRPDVFLISDESKNDLYVDYMREKYGLDVTVRPSFEGRTFTVYTVSSK